jgi:putative protein kinase ArgK-like GTPase of G3E family
MANSPDILARKLRAGDRATLARAITLIESKRADHQQTAHKLVQELLAETGKATRGSPMTNTPSSAPRRRLARSAGSRQKRARPC